MGWETHPFFADKEAALGQVHFRGQLYRNVPLLYDIYSDVLIYYHGGINRLPVLIEMELEDVEYFSMAGRHFQRVIGPDWISAEIGMGYVDVLYKGKHLSLLAKHSKEDYASITHREFQEVNLFYFRTESRLTLISRKKSLATLFPGQKSEISKFMKRNDLKIGSRNVDDMVELARFCDELITAEEN